MSGFAFPSTRTSWQHHHSSLSIRYTRSSNQKPVCPLTFPAPNKQHQAQCDTGVNISAMHNINGLHNTVDLEHPFLISSADYNVLAMMTLIRGTFVLPLSDGSTCNIPVYYFSSLADTIVSPQKSTSPVIQDCCYNVYCLIDLPGCCHILLSHLHDNDVSFIALQKSNALNATAGLMPNSYGPCVSCPATAPGLRAQMRGQPPL
jgi:hypothetical protein